MQKIKLTLDWNWIDNLSPKEYWDFVDSYNRMVCKLLILAEEDYRRKKARRGEKVDLGKMRIAVNQRKEIKEFGRNLIRLSTRGILGSE